MTHRPEGETAREGGAEGSTVRAEKGQADGALERRDDDPAGRRLIVEAAARARTVPPERWRAESDAAAVCARYLSCHPKVVWVSYPGLPGDPCHEEAARILERGFGPFIAYGTIDGGVSHLMCEGADPLDLVRALEAALA